MRLLNSLKPEARKIVADLIDNKEDKSSIYAQFFYIAGYLTSAEVDGNEFFVIVVNEPLVSGYNESRVISIETRFSYYEIYDI